jgi:hypothetical protein
VVLEPASAVATTGIRKRYKRQRRLLLSASAAASSGAGGSFKRRRRSLQAVAAVATNGRRRLLQWCCEQRLGATMVDGDAPWSQRCYHGAQSCYHGSATVLPWRGGTATMARRPFYHGVKALLPWRGSKEGGGAWRCCNEGWRCCLPADVLPTVMLPALLP